MSASDDSKTGAFEEANSMLSKGLKSCRAVVNNYRSLLASEAPDQPSAENDAGPFEGRVGTDTAS